MNPLRLHATAAIFAAFAISSSAQPAAPVEPIPGIISEWSLSPATRLSNLAAERFLDGRPAAGIDWLPVKNEPSGFVEVARHRKPAAQGTSLVWARTAISISKSESRPFSLNYTGEVSVYLNGQIVFHGRNPRQPGDPAGRGNDTVYLPLATGENELVLSSYGTTAAWDFMVRDLTSIYCHPALQPVWEIAGRLAAPESVAYDPGRRVLYVSNFGDGSISKIGLDGAILAQGWVTGFKAPTGLKFFNGRLFAVERQGIAEIDLDKAEIVRRHPVPGAIFINDLSIAEDGTIYLTDTFRNCVFKLSGEKAEILIEGSSVNNPNGILVERTRLIVGITSDGTLKAVDLATKQASIFVTLGPGANMDGLVSDGKDGYLFSDYFGRIYHADSTGRRILLLDRRGPQQGTADFEFIPETGLLVVPSLYDNRLSAFQLGALP